ncbi:MAG: glycosyltransferase family 4 protein, partial [Pseudomonadota bacterium]
VLASELPPATELLYVHFLHTPASVARYSAQMRGLPWGFSAHAKDIWTIPDWEKSEKIADANFGVTCTQSGATHLRQYGEDAIDLVYHGLDLARFPPPPERRKANQRFEMLSVGRLVEKKGYDDLLEALNLLPKAFDWHFTQIGGGRLSREMHTHARRLGLEKRITWLGKKDQTAVIAAMRDADLFILPSKIADDGDRDGLPNVLMEAASQKLPILSTAVSAIPEFITHGTHGYLTAPADPPALADAIAILAADPEIRERIADAAFERVRASFGMKTGIDKLEARLRAALATT